MASRLFFGCLMPELYVIGDIKLKSDSFDALLLIITFPSDASVYRAVTATSGGVSEESNGTNKQGTYFSQHSCNLGHMNLCHEEKKDSTVLSYEYTTPILMW